MRVRALNGLKGLALNPLSDTFLRTLAGLAAPGGRRGRLSILIYHRVLSDEDALNRWDPTAAQFEAQMRLLRNAFTPLPLSEAVDRLVTRSLPSRAVCVTFDDGYADNVDVALPILMRHSVPATFFIATGYLNGGRMWNDTVIESLRAHRAPEIDLEKWGLGVMPVATPELRRAAIIRVLSKLKHLSQSEREVKAAQLAEMAGTSLSDGLMMRDDQVCTLRRSGMDIGAHTVSHPILAKVSQTDARREIIESRERLSDVVKEPIRLFAYPNGKPKQDYAAEHVRIVRDAGFRAAVSTAWGAASPGSDVFQLPRFTPWDRNPAKFALRLLLNRRNTEPDVA